MARSGSWWDVEIHDLFQVASPQPPIHTIYIYIYMYILARIHKFQLAWMATYLVSTSKGKKVCVQASLSLSFMLFKTNIWNATWLPQSESDWQIRAQYLSPVVVRRAHSGVAVSPFGTSLGQLPVLSHLGLQKSPGSPCTLAACSSDSQPVLGLP